MLATGAHERLIPFPDNDRPGVMLAGAALSYLRDYGVLVGRRALVYTTNDTAYAVADELRGAGSTWWSPTLATRRRRRTCPAPG